MTNEEPARAEAESQEIPLIGKVFLTLLCVLTCLGAVASLYAVFASETPKFDDIVAPLAALAGTAVAATHFIAGPGREAREERRNVASSQGRLADAEERLVDSLAHGQRPSDGTGENLALPFLWKTTHARLKLYHDVALGQANRSFRSAHAAMWLGFAALALFVGVALNASSTANSVVAGGLGAVAAGLAGFIGRTFVRSQEHAAEHLRSYFDQPLEMARYLAAERLIADTTLSDEQRAQVLAAIVTAMVAGPQLAPADPQPPAPQTPPR